MHIYEKVGAENLAVWFFGWISELKELINDYGLYATNNTLVEKTENDDRSKIVY